MTTLIGTNSAFGSQHREKDDEHVPDPAQPGLHLAGRRADDRTVTLAARARDRTGSRLFLRYALASLLPVLLLGLVLVQGDRRSGRERGLLQGRAQAAVIEQMAVAPALEGHDLESGLSVDERARLTRATDLALFKGSISRLRLRTFSGRVVFSDDGWATTTGAGSLAVGAAGQGRTVVDVVADGAADGGHAMRVLQPVVPAASGQAVGILELSLPYAPIAALVHRQLLQTCRLLVAGLGGLYVVLALISWSTTRRLRRYAAEREHAAQHDALTGLPNRACFRDRADEALHDVRPGEQVAVVLVDLDGFKEVNDSLGHHAGDQLLRAVAQRLATALRTDDTVARLGGDEFGLVLPDAGSAEHVLGLLDRVRSELAADVEVDGVAVSVQGSFGVAMAPGHGTDVEELLRHADSAMYCSKRGAAGVVLHPGLPGGARAPGPGRPAPHAVPRRAPVATVPPGERRGLPEPRGRAWT